MECSTQCLTNRSSNRVSVTMSFVVTTWRSYIAAVQLPKKGGGIGMSAIAA